VTQERNRVVVKATLSPSMLSGMAAEENSPQTPETGNGQGASK